MIIKHTVYSFIILSIFSFDASIADTSKTSEASGEVESDMIERIDKFLESALDDNQVPGFAIAVVENSAIYTAKAFGVKSLKTREPITTSSIFHMASVSKPFAATAIMQLVEKKKMSLDDPLIKYLPYFRLDDLRYKDITIKQMLMHTSGIPDVDDYEWDKPQFDDDAAERYVRSLANEKVIAGPGEGWYYSNMAFDILADVIAKVSGVSFEDYVKENILNPLDMKKSDFLRARIDPDLRTTAHVLDHEPQVSDVYPYNRRHAPSSCLNANVIELSNWAIANMNSGVFGENRILEVSSYQLLFEPQAQTTENQAIGLSWFIDQYRGIKTVYHSGSDLGYRSYLIMLPEKSLAIIAASNYEETPMDDLVYGVIDIMLGFEPE